VNLKECIVYYPDGVEDLFSTSFEDIDSITMGNNGIYVNNVDSKRNLFIPYANIRKVRYTSKNTQNVVEP